MTEYSWEWDKPMTSTTRTNPLNGDTYRPKPGHWLNDEADVPWQVLKVWDDNGVTMMNITSHNMDGHYWETIFYSDAYEYTPRHSYDYIPWDNDMDGDYYQIYYVNEKRARHRA